MKLEPKSDNSCFGCGGANGRGMKLEFEQHDEQHKIRGKFQLGAEYEGGGGNLHGGIIAVLFDEAMGKVNRFRDVRAVTAQLSVDYLRPIKCGEKFVIEAYEVDAQGRNLFHEAEIKNEQGQVLARAKGRFVVVSERAADGPQDTNRVKSEVTVQNKV